MASVTIKCESDNTNETGPTFEERKAFLQGNTAKIKKAHRKRRHSLNEDVSMARKHRRQASSQQKKGSVGDIILPNKFLLGGNISDPLNLNSMLDENVNRALNAVTPKSSPLPPRSSTVNIVIPPDMTDPLGLNASTEESPIQKDKPSLKDNNEVQEKEAELKANNSSNKKKRKRRKSLHEKSASGENLTENSELSNNEKVAEDATAKTKKIKKLPPNVLAIEERGVNQLKAKSMSVDPIVSPVIPQDVKPSALSASKVRKKRSSIASGKQLTFNIPEVDTMTSQSGNNETLAVPIDSQAEAVQTAQTKVDNACVTHVRNNKPHVKSNTAKVKPKSARFQYGNYNQYYGYRNPQKFKDNRMECFKKEWFKDKDVLDVGCNVGHLTVLIARDFDPRKIVGIDIDDSLIKAAQMNIRHYSTANTRPSQQNGKYPECMSVQFGPIHGPPLETGKNDSPTFPNNVKFFKGNYVPEKDDVLKYQEPEYDIILCMSVTKWIHLNWGDKGLIRTFQRFFKQLRPGGKLILEPQDFSSYRKKKKLTETIFQNFHKLQLKPLMFPEYLVKEIGFEKVEFLKMPTKDGKGFQRSIQLYYKPE